MILKRTPPSVSAATLSACGKDLRAHPKPAEAGLVDGEVGSCLVTTRAAAAPARWRNQHCPNRVDASVLFIF